MSMMIFKQRTIELMEKLDQSLQNVAYFGANGKSNEHKHAIQHTKEILSDLDMIKNQMGKLS